MISIEYQRSALKDIGKLEQSIKKELIQEVEKIWPVLQQAVGV